MSKAVKPLIILIFLLSIAALVLGSMLYGQREVVKGRTQKLESAAQQIAANIQYTGFNPTALQDYEKMDQQLRPLGDAAKAQRQELTQTKSTLGEVETKLQETKESLATTTTANEELGTKVTQLETQVADTLQQLEQARILLAQRSTSQGTSQVQGTTGEIAALMDEHKRLQRDFDDLMVAYEELEAQAGRDPSNPNVIVSDVEGRVLIVNPDWNFVVIDVGFRDDLQDNVVLLVHRDKVPIGKIRTNRVEKNMSVAEIITRWDDSGVMSGDIVVSPAAGS